MRDRDIDPSRPGGRAEHSARSPEIVECAENLEPKANTTASSPCGRAASLESGKEKRARTSRSSSKGKRG